MSQQSRQKKNKKKHVFLFAHIADVDCEKESPTALLWTYYFLAQHYDICGHTQKALDTVNLAVEHTCTLIELFTVKARIYKVST